MSKLVLDTNIVLDLFVFKDPSVRTLTQALQSGGVQWLATNAMRDELARVLDYPKISAYLARVQIGATEVMTAFDQMAEIHPAPAAASVICSDADDQKFIDLALAHQASLISKDEAVLQLAKPLAALGVRVQSMWVN
jgi:putative PIN family toxin of toxin-antitoxin system